MNNDLISRSALKEEIENLIGYSLSYEALLNAIDNAPTVEPIKQCKYCKHCGNEDYCSNCHSDYSLFEYYERPHGEWKHIVEEDNDVECPFCGFQDDGIYYNYCPSCGADMRKGGAE